MTTINKSIPSAIQTINPICKFIYNYLRDQGFGRQDALTIITQSTRCAMVDEEFEKRGDKNADHNQIC